MEVKFRAVNAKNEFIYGLPYTDGVNITAYYDEYNNRLCWRDEEGASCNMPYKNGTLMQFTGLLDKEGNEIYEGDLLDFDEREWGGEFEPEIINMDLILGKWDLAGSLSDVSQFRKVVGNIYNINQTGELNNE